MAPVVQDGDDLMIESAAILETLLNRHGDGRLRPATDTPGARALPGMDALRGEHRLAADPAGVHQPRPAAGQTPEAEARRFGGSARVMKYYDAPWPAALPRRRRLHRRRHPEPLRSRPASLPPRTAGACPPAAAAGRRGFAPYPAVADYMARLADRPAFQRMMAMTMPQGWPSI